MKPIQEKVSMFGQELSVLLDSYSADGSIALSLADEEGMPYATATVCMAGEGLSPSPNCIFVKDYSENEGMFSALVDAGIVVPAGQRIDAGFAAGGVVHTLLSPSVLEQLS